MVLIYHACVTTSSSISLSNSRDMLLVDELKKNFRTQKENARCVPPDIVLSVKSVLSYTRHRVQRVKRQKFLFQQITNILVLAQESYGLYRNFNLTGFFKRNLNAEPYQYDVPVLRDISYLPEEDYNVEHENNDEISKELDRQDRNLMPEYRNLCEIVTKRVQFNDENYEYQPPHYHEVFCKSYSRFDQGTDRAKRSTSKQKCAHPGFHCVQRSRMLFVVRRAWDSDCWEPFTKEIASGCDCMWPVSILGDIAPHY